MDALIIKPEWLDRILHNGKCLEIRGSKTKKRGKIALAESGSSLIKGTCTIETCTRVDEELWRVFKNDHQVNITYKELLQRYPHPHAWLLENVKEFKEPVKYNHPKGAVIWVKDVL